MSGFTVLLDGTDEMSDVESKVKETGKFAITNAGVTLLKSDAVKAKL